jgi:hypothetical protein
LPRFGGAFLSICGDHLPPFRSSIFTTAILFWINISLLRSATRLAMSPLKSPEYWQRCAAIMRSLAEHMRDPKGKASMMRIAEDYEFLARLAEAGFAEDYEFVARLAEAGLAGSFGPGDEPEL